MPVTETETDLMTRTKSWLLVGTILPALVLSQGGFALTPDPARYAQAPAPADNQPERPRGAAGEGRPEQPRRERAPGVPRAPDPQRQPGAERPRPPATPNAAPPTAPRPPAGAAPQPERNPPMPRPAPQIIAPDSQAPGSPAARPIPVPPATNVPTTRPTPPRPPGADSTQPRTAPVTPPAPPAAAPARPLPPVAPQVAPVPPPPAATPAAPANRVPPASPAPQAAPTPAPAPQPSPQTAPQSVPDAQRPGVPPALRTDPAPGQPPAIPPVPAQRAPGADPAMPRPAAPIIAPDGQRPGGPADTRPQPAPGQPPAVPTPAERQSRRGGLGLGGAAAIGLGAGVIGGIMATQGADRLDDVRSRREERREGDVTIIREPGRTIIRDDDRVIIRRDETQRFRDLGYEGRTERRGDENRTVFERPDGTRVVTITDDNGRLLRRMRLDRDGREFVIIDNTRRDRPNDRFSDEIVVLERPQLAIPRDRYIVDADGADERMIYETIIAPPIAPIPRRYTLDEVRYSPDLRARMRSVDIDTVTFDSASWDIAPGQVQRLEVIAKSIRQALDASPNEVFLVEGHTDAVGPDIDNLSLSDRRAQSVAEILSRDFGVPPENLTTQGYGEQYLKVATQEAARENRRVTLRRITPLLAGQNAP